MLAALARSSAGLLSGYDWCQLLQDDQAAGAWGTTPILSLAVQGHLCRECRHEIPGFYQSIVGALNFLEQLVLSFQLDDGGFETLDGLDQFAIVVAQGA